MPNVFHKFSFEGIPAHFENIQFSYHKGIVGGSKDVSNTEDELIVANLRTKRNVLFNFSLAYFLIKN